MKNSRRKFLKLAGASAVGISFSAGAIKALENTETSKTEPHGVDVSDFTDSATPDSGAHAEVQKKEFSGTAKHWGMVIDTRKFHTPDDLKPLIEACEKSHNIPHHKNKNHEIKWIWEEYYHNTFPSMENEYLAEELKHRPIPVLCNHCENPSCVKACPTKATFKRKDGIVLMDFHRCIGCRFCMAACPYGSRSFNFLDPRPAIRQENYNPKFPTRDKGVVEKCNFCAERLAEGKPPACMEVSKGAIVFGDLGDPGSEIREVLKSNFTVRRNPSLGTAPSVYYIL
ncbi:sulfate reduction electron transfer complex DsrMKJOP subunit DsrO [Fibrobacterota bacterium]